MKRELLSLTNIVKRIDGATVLDGVTIDVFKWDIHCVLLQSLQERNCLFDILTGNLTPDSGQMSIHGRPVVFHSPYDAAPSKVYSIHADSKLISNLSIAENLFLTSPRFGRFGFKHVRKLPRLANEVLRSLSLDYMEGDMPVQSLTQFDRYLIELVKGVMQGAELIVLDDFMEKLTEHELTIFTGTIEKLKRRDISFLCLFDHLDKVLDIFNRVTLILNGMTVATLDGEEVTERNISRCFPIARRGVPPHSTPYAGSAEVFSGRNIRLPGAIEDGAFCLHEGEALGIVCRDYPGGMALSEGLCGRAPLHGALTLRGAPVRFRSCADAVAKGVALVRVIHEQAVFPNLDLEQNVSVMMSPGILTTMGIEKKRLKAYATETALTLLHEADMMDEFRRSPIGHLPASRQYAIALARAIAAKARVLVLFNPQMTFGAKNISQFTDYVAAIKRQGISLLIISMDKNLLSSFCDNVIQFP